MLNVIEIPAPLSDRTLKYGRNVLAVSAIILVLAYVPYIDVTTFKPLGFDLEKGGEISVWGILAAVLFYYGAQFVSGCWIEYPAWIRSLTPGDKAYSNPDQTAAREDYVFAVKGSRRRFWGLDLGFPVLALVAAFPTACWRMYQLCPSCQYLVD